MYVFNAGKYILEEWANFVLFLSPHVFGDVLRKHIPKMAAAWEHYRKAMLFYFRGYSMVSGPGPSYDALRKEAKEDMWKCAVILEKSAPPYLHTLNLRFLVVHLDRYVPILL